MGCRNLRILLMIFLAGMVLRPDSSFGQPSWKTKLAYRLAESIQAIQNFCIERAQVECEILELEHNPPYLRKGQSIDYIGVRKREVTYFYLVVTEADEMAPDIYLFDSRGKLLSTGLVLKDAALAVHRPEYTQKVIQRIRMSRGSGHIGFAVLAPVGD